ncbi:hypothetical protein VUR80DRAFT_3127 [Thermomyces stellatus]
MATHPAPPSLPDASNGNATEQVGQAPGDITAHPTHQAAGDASALPDNAQGQATITPEPRPEQLAMNNHTSQATPSTPGLLSPFDWEDFQDRYEKALADADKEERAVLKEFDRLSKYFNVWASSASAHDNERAVKRLQTRQRYVSLSEESMAQKQKHYDEVMKAFQSALALLSSK